MGLTIKAITGLHVLPMRFGHDGLCYLSGSYVSGNPADKWFEAANFEGKERYLSGLVLDGIYKYDSEQTFYRASYAGYEEFLDWLSEIAFEYGSNEFLSLVDFGESGIMGPFMCADILEDFDALYGKRMLVDKRSDTAEMLQMYDDMMTALKTASDNGALMFC